MSDFRTRKEQRRKAYEKLHGNKLVVCTACNGSGCYDSNGSPACGACAGTGQTRSKES